jgi:DNA-binding IclR family transcriptional regulator
MPEAQVDDIIRRGLIRYNENTIVSGVKLKKELVKVREQGFAIDDEEETLGLRCIGVPILQEGQPTIAAISIAGSISEIHYDNLDGLTRLVRDASARITDSLQQDHSGSG